jgi:hypothetical protein
MAFAVPERSPRHRPSSAPSYGRRMDPWPVGTITRKRPLLGGVNARASSSELLLSLCGAPVVFDRPPKSPQHSRTDIFCAQEPTTPPARRSSVALQQRLKDYAASEDVRRSRAGGGRFFLPGPRWLRDHTLLANEGLSPLERCSSELGIGRRDLSSAGAIEAFAWSSYGGRARRGRPLTCVSTVPQDAAAAQAQVREACQSERGIAPRRRAYHKPPHPTPCFLTAAPRPRSVSPCQQDYQRDSGALRGLQGNTYGVNEAN